MARRGTRKQSTWFDAKVSPAERLEAFHALSPRARDTLTRIGYRPGSVPTMEQEAALFDAHQADVLKGVVTACREAMRKRTLESVNGILRSLKAVEVVATNLDPKLEELAWRWVVLIVQEVELNAYRAFREHPSSANYAACWGARKALDALDIPGNTGYPVDPWSRCIVRSPLRAGPYTVARGDSLSKIAQRYYGQANLWDAIFETNGYDGNPDLIFPGTVLTIYAGP